MSHDHSHDHDHSHSHSYGHTVPWGGAAARWYEPGWSAAMCRHTILSAELMANDRVLDASGAGTDAAAAAAAWIKQGTVTVVLAAEQHTAGASALVGHPDANRISLVEGALEDLPVADGGASVAWAIDAIGRWQDPAQCIASLRRALRPGGRLILSAKADACGLPGQAADDPKPLQALLASGGFRGIEVRRYRDGEQRILIFMARRPWS